jgi:hypothetical protein
MPVPAEPSTIASVRRVEDRLRDAETRVTWRSAVILSVLAALAATVSIGNLPSTPLLVARLVSIGWSLASLAVLVLARRHLGLRGAKVMFGLTSIPLLPTLWFLAVEPPGDLPYEVFTRASFVVIIYAFATPPSATISLLVIAALAIESVLLFEIVPSRAHGFAPWTSLLFAAASAGIALYRAYRQRQEVLLIVELEQAAAMRRLGRAYLAMCDLANTPLQNLQIAVSMVEERYPDAGALTSSMQRSVARLHDLNEVLATESSKIRWGKETNFDPFAALRVHVGGPR